MSEINGSNFSVNQVNYNNIRNKSKEVVNESNPDNSKPQLKDFSDSKAEALGRSMLIKDVDGINNDLKALVENPQIAENSDDLFEKAYKVAVDNGSKNPYEDAATASTTSI